MAAEHAVQVRALGAAVVAGLGAVAQRALLTEEGLAGIGIGRERRNGTCSAASVIAERMILIVVPCLEAQIEGMIDPTREPRAAGRQCTVAVAGSAQWRP